MECVPILRIAQREGGDSVLAGSSAPQAKIGFCEIKIAEKREVRMGGAFFFGLFTFSCSAASARCHMQLSLQLKKDIVVFEEKEGEGMIFGEVW